MEWKAQKQIGPIRLSIYSTVIIFLINHYVCVCVSHSVVSYCIARQPSLSMDLSMMETSSMTHLDKTWDFDPKPHRGAAPGAIEVTVSLGMKV